MKHRSGTNHDHDRARPSGHAEEAAAPFASWRSPLPCWRDPVAWPPRVSGIRVAWEDTLCTLRNLVPALTGRDWRRRRGCGTLGATVLRLRADQIAVFKSEMRARFRLQMVERVAQRFPELAKRHDHGWLQAFVDERIGWAEARGIRRAGNIRRLLEFSAGYVDERSMLALPTWSRTLLEDPELDESLKLTLVEDRECFGRNHP